MHRRERHTDTRVDTDLDAVDLHRVQQRLARRFRRADRRFLVDVRQQHGELIAAESRDAQRLRDSRAQSHADVGQELVTGGMAERVVDVLEPVEVEQQHRKRPAVGEHLVRDALEHQPVRQLGERVVGRLVLVVRDLTAQLVGELAVGEGGAGVLRERVQQLLLVVAERRYGAAAADPQVTEHSPVCGERHGDVAVVVRAVVRRVSDPGASDHGPVVAQASRSLAVEELELRGGSVECAYGADHDLVGDQIGVQVAAQPSGNLVETLQRAVPLLQEDMGTLREYQVAADDGHRPQALPLDADDAE